MSKTPSPGQSLDLVSEGRRRGKRGREEEKGVEGKRGKEEEERITVISITPQPMVAARPLPAPIAPQPAAGKKSNLRTATRCQIFSSQSPSVMFPPPSYPPFVPRQPQPPPPPPPEYQGREEEGVDEDEEEVGDEYQIEDIEREIQRGGEDKRDNAGQNR